MPDTIDITSKPRVSTRLRHLPARVPTVLRDVLLCAGAWTGGVAFWGNIWILYAWALAVVVFLAVATYPWNDSPWSFHRPTPEPRIVVHDIATDGYPDMTADDNALIGRTAFIFDGAIVSGWPIGPDLEGDMQWEPSEDRFNLGGPVVGVTHWVEFPVPAWELER